MNEQFEKWWSEENMEDRVLADYEGFLEAGNECLDGKDLVESQKSIAEVAWEAAKGLRNGK